MTGAILLKGFGQRKRNGIRRDNMDEKVWKEFKEAIEEGQELAFDYKDEEWWISRVPEEKSFLLTRSRDSYTQAFKTAEELFKQGIIDGKPFIERIKDL